jgi:hypothetical protein
MQMMAAHLYEKPRALSELRAGVSPELSDVIARCLEKSPAARFAAMGELEEALRGSVSAGDWTAAQARDWWSDQRKAPVEPASAA